MDLIKPVTRLLEGRQASFVWRQAIRLIELFFHMRMRLRPAAADDVDLRDRFCMRPFEMFELHESGRAYLCCPTWLPWSAGNLHAEDAATIWNSERAQEIRRSILDGDFKYCNRDLCPAIVGNNLPKRTEARTNAAMRAVLDGNKRVMAGKPKIINLSNDRSCNLSCPSCRTKRINFTGGLGYEVRKKLQDRLTAAFFSEPTDEAFTVNVTGSGDPFASRVFREFLLGLDRKDFPNLNVSLQTNGTLFNEKNWNRLSKIQGNISEVIVSFDAATEETYKITRRGGDWGHLVRNTEFLSGLRKRGLIKMLRLDYVVQRANFREMPAFARQAERLTLDHISFSKATNLGTWSLAEFKDVCVWEPDHPDYPEFLRVITDPMLDHPKVALGNLARDRQRAQALLVRQQAAE